MVVVRMRMMICWAGASGVVDSQLRVLGVQKLRVADASVFPASPSGHLDAPLNTMIMVMTMM
eukprot:11380078-Karenia_brevis.AAC.1